MRAIKVLSMFNANGTCLHVCMHLHRIEDGGTFEHKSGQDVALHKTANRVINTCTHQTIGLL